MSRPSIYPFGAGIEQRHGHDPAGVVAEIAIRIAFRLGRSRRGLEVALRWGRMPNRRFGAKLGHSGHDRLPDSQGREYSEKAYD